MYTHRLMLNAIFYLILETGADQLRLYSPRYLSDCPNHLRQKYIKSE